MIELERHGGYYVTETYPGLVYRFGLSGGDVVVEFFTADGKLTPLGQFRLGGGRQEAFTFATNAYLWAKRLMPPGRSLDEVVFGDENGI